MPSRLHFRTPPVPEHPDVPAIEEVLGLPSTDLAEALAQGRSVVALRAVWVCGCDALEDVPTWLIIEQKASASWCRVPQGVEPSDVVLALEWCGGHTAPESMLGWLKGQSADPFSSEDFGSADALDQLRERILERPR